MAPIGTNAAESQWYWVSVPGDTMTGYFSEGLNTIGKTESTYELWTTVNGRPTVSVTQTPLPDNFMEVMKVGEDSDKCFGVLDTTISKLRKYDSVNEIVSSLKSSEWANVETISGREKLLKQIKSNTEECLEIEKKEISEAEQKIEEVDKIKVGVNRADLLKQIQSLLALLAKLQLQLAGR